MSKNRETDQLCKIEFYCSNRNIDKCFVREKLN